MLDLTFILTEIVTASHSPRWYVLAWSLRAAIEAWKMGEPKPMLVSIEKVQGQP